MTRDEVLKKRGESFDAAARLARASRAIEDAQQQLEAARAEYNDAWQALSAMRREADALEANAVSALLKNERARDPLPILLPIERS